MQGRRLMWKWPWWVDCELKNSIGNSDTLIDYDRLDQGTNGCKILHSGNLAKGSFDHHQV